MSNDEGTPVGPNDQVTENSEKVKNNTEETVEAQKTHAEVLKEIAKLAKQTEESSKLQLANQIKINEILKDNANFLGDLTERNKLNVEILKDQALLELEKLKESKQINDETFKEQKKRLKEIEQFGSSEIDSLSDQFPVLENIIDNLKEQSKIKRGGQLIDKVGLTVHKDIAKTLGVKVKVQDTFLGQIGMLGTLLSENKEKQDEILAGLKNQVKEAFHYRKIAASVFTAIFENSKKMFENFDSAQAALAATTAQGREFNDVLYETGRQGNLFGISMEKAASAIGVLVNETSNFTSLSKAQQENVALTVAKMEQLNVAASDSAKIFQNFNQGLGISADESIRIQKELAMAGVSIGISASKITKDFNAALSTLMVYGRESIDVFKGIAAAAKAAGVETSTLLSVASKFDTFAGAAEGAGKLNALLGTQLSTTEMLLATEDERIRMLVESVQSQGVAFQDMDKFTQLAIANAAGITDMAEANRIFGMSLSEYDKNERQLKKSADAQKKFDDAVSKTVKVMDQFKLLGAEIVVALEPFFEILGGLAENLTEFFKEMDTGTKEVLALFLTGLTGLVLIWPALSLMFVGLATAGVTTLPILGTGAEGAATGLTSLGAGFTTAATGAASFAASMVGVTIQIVAVVGVVALLAAAIAGIVFGLSKLAMGVVDLFSSVGSSIADVVNAISGNSAEASEAGASAAKSMASIVAGNHESALASIRAMVSEINSMGQDVKVSSTIENLALITAGKSTSITGQRVASNTTRVTTNVQNSFEGLKMKLVIDDKTEFNTHLAIQANGD